MKTHLSIIIISYNTKDLTIQTLDHLIHALGKQKELHFEIILIDNGSTDGSIEILKKYSEKSTDTIAIQFIQNSSNLGFGIANNEGLSIAKGEYILFLNSDIIINELNFIEILDYMDIHQDVGVLTVKVVLKDGSLDMACHRGFPTLWRSFTYFSKLEKLTSKNNRLSAIFGGYHLLNKDFNTIHEIDSPTGAFYLTRKSIMNTLSGFDPDYFFYGEDLDLSYRVKKLGFKVIYYPLYTIIHLKNQSGIKRGIKKVESKTKEYFFEAMSIFYDKHFAKDHTPFMNKIVHGVINFKKKFG
jgi:GT2 family glycosyltransferase